ncbi:hypothetical protein [Streptomyces sp. CAU 1734]|uniref:hypothetical protein n=1 Tax=Streptomyces sp. CAU 1734 TaxID=3140360 RepID=UPI00326018A0
MPSISKPKTVAGRVRAIVAALGTGESPYHVTITPTADGCTIGVDGRRGMTRKEEEEAETYPSLYQKFAERDDADADRYILHLLSALRTEFRVEGQGPRATTAADLFHGYGATVTPRG